MLEFGLHSLLVGKNVSGFDNPVAFQDTAGDDVSLVLFAELDLDLGDAPSPYPTQLPDTMACAVHSLGNGLVLGSLVDGEADGQPTSLADGDDLQGLDDEDGVTLPAAFNPGQQATLSVVASVAAELDAFFDFNRNGSWLDAGESFSFSLVAGNNTLSVTPPLECVAGGSFARLSARQGDWGPRASRTMARSKITRSSSRATRMSASSRVSWSSKISRAGRARTICRSRSMQGRSWSTILASC